MFNLVVEFDSEYGNHIAKYRSDQTNLTVLFIDVEGPIVNGFFALSTESHDDDGCPHTLEHLVFLGSEKFPYKGVLDRLANRSLAQGTNAWTDTDNVVFTISTAGYEGFLNIVPIYLDHILYCTLTDTAFHTEVHHINDKGENAGVVYSEMQGRQNSGPDLLHLRMLRAAYPGDCGYKSETGGLMENIRVLTIEKIRKFHQDFFRPDNLCLIITGKVDPKLVFESLQPVEEKILKKGPLPPMKRPWVESFVPSLEKSLVEVVEFPDEDESVGEVRIAWHGPSIHDFFEKKAIEVLLEYLSDSSVSLLSKNLVEIEEPYCSEITHHFISNLKTLFYLTFENAATEKQEQIQPLVWKVFEEHTKSGIDMNRMEIVLENIRLQSLSSIESNPHYTYALNALGDFLYGDLKGSELALFLREQEFFKQLKTFTSDQWIAILKKYFLDNPYVLVIGKPSGALSKKLAEDEKARISEQRTRLGDEKLQLLKKQLEEATANNERPIPPSIIESFPIPGVSNISFFPVISSSSPHPNKVKEKIFGSWDQSSFPIPVFHFDHVESAFVEIKIFFDTTGLPSHLRPYLRLYLDSFFELPIEKDGQILPYEEVVEYLDKISISKSATLGLSPNSYSYSGDFGQLIAFKMKCLREKYEENVSFLSLLVWKSVFDPERLTTYITKLISELPQEKREGMPITRLAMRVLNFNKDNSNYWPCSVFNQTEFLEQVQKNLQENPKSVVENLEALRNSLCYSENLIVDVAGRVLEIQDPKKPWIDHFANHKKGAKKEPLFKPSNHLLAAGKEPSNRGFVINLPTIESSFSLHVSRGPSSYDDPDIPAVLVLTEYLTTMEGVFWKQIRGQGLAYSCDINHSPDQGLIAFQTYRAPDAYKAFSKAKMIVEDLASGKLEFDLKDIDGAKSGAIFGAISDEETLFDAANQSFLNHILKKRGEGATSRLLTQIKEVTLADLQRVLHKYIKNVFDPKHSNTVVVTAPSKYEEIQQEFRDAGYNLIALDSIDSIRSHL